MSVFGGCNTFWLLLPCRIFLKKKRSWHASTWFSPFPADAIAELQTQRLPWPPVIQRYMVLVYRSSCIIQQSSFIVCFGRHQNPIKCYQSVNMQFAASMSTAKKIHEKMERNLGNVWKLHWKKTSFHSRPQPYFDPMLQRSLRLQGIASDGLGTYVGPKRLTIPTSKRHQKRLEVWQRPEVLVSKMRALGSFKTALLEKPWKWVKNLCVSKQTLKNQMWEFQHIQWMSMTVRYCKSSHGFQASSMTSHPAGSCGSAGERNWGRRFDMNLSGLMTNGWDALLGTHAGFFPWGCCSRKSTVDSCHAGVQSIRSKRLQNFLPVFAFASLASLWCL